MGHQPATRLLARRKCHHYHTELAPRVPLWNLNCFPVFLVSSPRSPPALSLSSTTLPLSCGTVSWQPVNIYTYGEAGASIDEDRFSGSPCNWLSFFFFFFSSPSCYSLFIQPAFSMSAAPILTVLLSNWQPTLSLKCKKCFITMGPAKPLIMHRNMAVKRECMYLFLWKILLFWAFSESPLQIFTLRSCFCSKFAPVETFSHFSAGVTICPKPLTCK